MNASMKKSIPKIKKIKTWRNYIICKYSSTNLSNSEI